MNALHALSLSAALATVASLALVLFLRRPLHELLVELCGNAMRARFWSVYWAALLVLGALFGLLLSAPLDETGRWKDLPLVPLVLTGLRTSLLTMLLVLAALAVVLLGSIRRFERASSLGQRSREPRGPEATTAPKVN